MPSGQETILVVEDELSVRDLVRRVLEHQGYRVLDAGTPEDAEKLFAAHRPEIALLLTDIVMPGQSGLMLYQSLARKQPTLKVLFMSGYSSGAAARNGALQAGAPFIEKPFDAGTLAVLVRDLLDGDTAPRSTSDAEVAV